MNNHPVKIEGTITQYIDPSTLKKVYYFSVRGVGNIKISRAHAIRLMIMNERIDK